uniref:Uncharacterized protein n=1 Tax=Arundo donax TaxID=35708 RepID=A0A0A8YHI2_ARUDO
MCFLLLYTRGEERLMGVICASCYKKYCSLVCIIMSYICKCLF